MTEPIEMPFEELTRVGPRNHVLDGVEIPHGRGNFGGCPDKANGRFLHHLILYNVYVTTAKVCD